MNHIAITLSIIGLALVLFAWNPVPAVVVAIGASLALFFTGVLTMPEALTGFGDPVVILIAALLAIAVAVETTGVGAWAGQLLLRLSGASEMMLLVALSVVAAIFSALIGMNGAVAAMLPVTVTIAVRTGIAPSHLMIPLALACLKGAKLTLLGSPVNVIAATQAEEMGVGHIGFFEWSVLGIPQLVGSIIIVMLFGKRLLPDRRSESIPADFSGHAQTLVQHYNLEHGLHQLAVSATSALIGTSRKAVDLGRYAGLRAVAFLDCKDGRPLERDLLDTGDLILVRGDGHEVDRMAADLQLEVREHGDKAALGDVLLSRDSGLAEVVVPERSALIGSTVFPGMTSKDHEVMVLAVQRGGAELVRPRLTLRSGDHLLLQGSWPALERYLSSAQLLVIDSPDEVRVQAVALGRGAKRLFAIMALLVVLLVFNIMPAPIACLLCACLVVVTGVVRLPQVYRGLDWNTVLLIGAMIAPARAMEKSGAAEMIGNQIVTILGGFGPIAVLVGLFLAATLITQFISNTSTALVTMPIALAAASDMHVSALPMVMSVAMGASASFLTPFANGVSLMVYGPGGYKFGDFWKLGLVVLAWTLAVTVIVTPLYWPFH
ncbi:SLC13 family permease [Rhizobium calliandrae]|uniref:SLC13 family permease n=1 Tax=Rhizobium calliandrae TaxID=1312182 RepID=A0ABT7KJN2_9HYPH|nr:SLC13 family permease [Rhizobium calliandrae]MDL2408849.1 SLC13 family permease [Rhizobium calliandrae]